MSEIVVASTAVSTSVLALPLLAAAGVMVAAGWAVSRLAATLAQPDHTIGVNGLAQGFIEGAQQARERLLADLKRSPQTAHTSPKQREAAGALARVRAIQEAFSKQPVLALVAEAHRGQVIREAGKQALQAQESFQRGAFGFTLRESEKAEEALARAAHEALAQLQDAQQHVVAQAVRTALPQLGYKVEEAVNQQAVAFRARSGEHVLGIVILEGGKLLVDAAGFTGTECRPAIEVLYRRLKDEGVAVHPEARALHQQRDGGPLLTCGNGAEGLLDRAASLREKAKKGGVPQEQARRRTAAWVWEQAQRMRR